MAMTSMVNRQLLLIAASLLLIVLCGLALGARVDTPPARSCVISDCHVEYRVATHMHAPVAAGVCKFCHRPASDEGHQFKLLREGSDLCSMCHWELESHRNIHQGFGGEECISCHDPHGSDYRFLLPEATIEDTCESCHADIFSNRSVMHTPVATGSCTVCHDPHDAEPQRSAAETADLCFQCHEATRDELETLDYIHAPVMSGSCADCHDPHGSDHTMHLIDDVPGLCYRCHEDIRTTVETATHEHSVAGEPGGCIVCHSPHASSVRFGLKSDSLTLCRSCHENEITNKDGDTITGFAHQVEGKKFLHGPVRQRDCGACHNSHGSNNDRLLIGEYSPEFYATFDLDNFQLCFSCHPQRGVLTEETTNLTDFRNGSRNLHYAHVNKVDKGRTCRACHATHGSDQPKHISEWIWFGEWKLPIKFEKTASGGSCDSGCHSLRAYDRHTPVEYLEESLSLDGDEAPQAKPEGPMTKGEQ